MSKSIHVDYIIVGQGLAGSAVAIQLLKLGKRILVIDQTQHNTSSRIAAGLFNPITGRRVVKTWMADILFPYLHRHYQHVEALSGERFFYPMRLYRPFGAIAEQNEWMGRSEDSEFSPYIDEIFTKSVYPDISDDYGGLKLNQCGYVNTRAYIGAVRRLVEENGFFLAEEADLETLYIESDGVHYKNFEARQIVICTGTHTFPWFDWVPIRPLKGETLCIESSYNEELIINRGVYMVPGNRKGEWRIGATYDLHGIKPGITELARVELTEKMKELVTFPFNIVGQDWGFRPTTKDRRPILGRHPALKRLYIFNGMGTKGVSLTPFLAEMLTRFIENGDPINKEVDLERYKLLYWSSPK